MHSVELLDQALDVLKQLSYQVRQEFLGGNASGACEIKGQRWFFLDLDLSPREQLEQIAAVLLADPRVAGVSLSPGLSTLLDLRRAA